MNWTLSKDDVGKLVVFFPPSRFYGMWETKVHRPSNSMLVGRVFRLDDFQSHTLFLQPVEGSNQIQGVNGYFVVLDDLPPAPEEFWLAKLRSSDFLSQSECEPPIWLDPIGPFAKSYSGPRKSLKKQGIVHGVDYKVAEWIVPKKTLRILGKNFCYYHGLFEPAH